MALERDALSGGQSGNYDCAAAMMPLSLSLLGLALSCDKWS